jgi:phosphoserine phosphatase
MADTPGCIRYFVVEAMMTQTPVSLPDFWTAWPGFDCIFFDCDSTLSAVEGIDELARQKGKFEQVKQMTDAAMDGEVHLESIYDRRLELLCPTRAEVRALENCYRQNLVPDVIEVIQALKWAGKLLFIVSGGLLAAVRPFGEGLGIPGQNIRAVGIHYNHLSGQWWDYQQDQWGQRPDVEYLESETSPLIESQGKTKVIQELMKDHHGRSLLVGDGMSDLAARSAVDLFVGFGGVVSRPCVADKAEVFIQSNSFAPILPLALSVAERAKLETTSYRPVLNKGLALIKLGEVTFRRGSNDL